MFLKLSARPCLVVRAGTIAESKIGSLLEARGRVRVVAPEATPQVRSWAHSMLFECAQERTCGVASGATTRTRPRASRRLPILDSAMVPALTTRQGRAESLRNMGKS